MKNRKLPSSPYKVLRNSAKVSQRGNPWVRLSLAVIGVIVAMAVVLVPEATWISFFDRVQSLGMCCEGRFVPMILMSQALL